MKRILFFIAVFVWAGSAAGQVNFRSELLTKAACTREYQAKKKKFLLESAAVVIVSSEALASAFFVSCDDFRYKKNPDFDMWSWLHLIGGSFLYMGFRCVGYGETMALILSGVQGMFYEIYFDGIRHKDHLGADIQGDPTFVLLGAGLACGIDLLFQIHRNPRFAIVSDGRSLGVSIPLNGGR